jgi:hypothetical protein
MSRFVILISAILIGLAVAGLLVLGAFPPKPHRTPTEHVIPNDHIKPPT